MKHSPGPWTRPVHGVIADAKGITVADLTWVTTEHDEANACLIAAAPDLLAACKAVVDEDGFRGSALMRKRIEAMRAAIAKAEERS